MKIKTVKFQVVKEVELTVHDSWNQNELKNLAADLCDASFDISLANNWDLNDVEHSTSLVAVSMLKKGT